MNKRKFFMAGAGILLMLVILCVAGASIGGNGISGQIREEDKELIPDIPNDAYNSTVNGWETYCGDYVEDGSNVSHAVGYAIYHMPDSSTGNVLNYVMRYEAETNIYWDAQQFYNTYRVTHNLLVQYNKEEKICYILEEKPSNAKINISAQTYITTDSDDGAFTHYEQYSVRKNRSENVPITPVPEENKKGIEAQLDGLKNPGDYITIVGIGSSIDNVSYGIRFSCSA